MMSEQNNAHFYVGSLITSVLGGIIIIFSDFAWWYNYNAYLSVRSWGYIDFSFENLLIMPIILVVAGCLFFCTYASFIELKFPNKEGNSKLLSLGFIFSIVACAIVVIGGIVFIIIMLMDEPTDWGLDVGFFGSLIGSGLTILLLYLARSKQ